MSAPKIIAKSSDDENYLKFLEELLSEWSSIEDNEAYKDL